MKEGTGSGQRGRTAGQPGHPGQPGQGDGDGWRPPAGPPYRSQHWRGGVRRPPRHRPSWWGRPRWGSGPLRRPQEDRLAGGVAAGIAARTGLNVTLVRTVFALATLASGFGAAVYVLAWLLIPAAGEESSIASTALAERRGIGLAAAVGSVLVVVLLIADAFGATWLANLAWPLIITAAGLALIWQNASPQEQEVIRGIAEPLVGLSGHSRLRLMLRTSLAAALLGGGVAMLLAGHANRTVLRPLGGAALIIAAITVMLGPWWLNIARDLVTERQARARAEERADMAARVHDSVLQTLALIQRRAGSPQQVIQLARAQERELRSWLFGGQAPGSVEQQVTTLAAGVRLIQQEMEAQHGVAVEAVTVGDCPLDEGLGALLAAAREATLNAAKWSGAGVVSVFAEVEPEEVSLFVRDRGRGFDLASVPGDRKGLAESIHARMARHGGSATVRSVVGEGTEVTLRMPRPAGKPLQSRA